MTTQVEVTRDMLNPSQIELLRSRSREVLFSGGYGAGKTFCLALKALQLKAANPKAPGILIAPNWRTMWSVTYRRLMSILRANLPRQDIPALIDKPQECYLDFGDGVPLYLRSANNVDGYDGLDVGWAVGDECRYWNRMAYHVLQGRIRVKCDRPQLALVSTPAMGWMSEEFDSSKDGRQLIVASTRENAHRLAPGYIENIKASYSKRLWKALIEGEFTILEGAVYELFDPSETGPWADATPMDQRRLADTKVYLAVDPGYRRSAWLWIAEVAPMQWVVFDELMADNKTDQQCVDAVNARGWPIDEVWADPAAGATQSFEGASTIKALRGIRLRGQARGIRVISQANREIAYGVDKLRVLLGADQDPPQKIRIKFSQHMIQRAKRARAKRSIAKDLASYRYPEHKDGRALTDQPLKDGVTDHGCDALRYFAVGRWLCDQRLRKIDPQLRSVTDPGWRIANN